MTQSPARGRAPLVFAILGLLAALATGGAYAYREVWGRDERSPEQIVNEFLAATVSQNVERTAAVVCESWDPEQAVRRTNDVIPVGTNVTWRDVRLFSAAEGRAVVRATLGLRSFFNQEGGGTTQWTFNLVDEGGWRVCEARPLT